MSDEEKLELVPQIHEEGNALFKQGQIKEATEKYYNGIACLKNLQMKVWIQHDLYFMFTYCCCSVLLCCQLCCTCGD